MSESLRIQPTAAAIRAASVIAPESVKSGLPNYDQILKAAFCKTIAQIIDRETGLPELIAACDELLMQSACPLGHEKAERYHQACIKAQTALEKARKL